MKIVPILVGALSAENEAVYGRLLAKYVDDPTNFFSISSDFCHWGSRLVMKPAFPFPYIQMQIVEILAKCQLPFLTGCV